MPQSSLETVKNAFNLPEPVILAFGRLIQDLAASETNGLLREQSGFCRINALCAEIWTFFGGFNPSLALPRAFAAIQLRVEDIRRI